MPKPPLPDHLQEMLARPNPAVIATVAATGAPSTVATWYVWEGGRALVNMDESRARLEQMRRDPRVSLTVLDGDEWYRHVSLRGRIALTDDTDFADIDRIARHYMGQPFGHRDSRRVSGWIEVDSWHAWNGGRPWT
jgi:PPOX class probable F420-dependent enzyme